MHTLTWLHTRKGTPMTARGTFGAMLIRAMMVRHVAPGHPMLLDGKPLNP